MFNVFQRKEGARSTSLRSSPTDAETEIVALAFLSSDPWSRSLSLFLAHVVRVRGAGFAGMRLFAAHAWKLKRCYVLLLYRICSRDEFRGNAFVRRARVWKLKRCYVLPFCFFRLCPILFSSLGGDVVWYVCCLHPFLPHTKMALPYPCLPHT